MLSFMKNSLFIRKALSSRWPISYNDGFEYRSKDYIEKIGNFTSYFPDFDSCDYDECKNEKLFEDSECTKSCDSDFFNDCTDETKVVDVFIHKVDNLQSNINLLVKDFTRNLEETLESYTPDINKTGSVKATSKEEIKVLTNDFYLSLKFLLDKNQFNTKNIITKSKNTLQTTVNAVVANIAAEICAQITAGTGDVFLAAEEAKIAKAFSDFSAEMTFKSLNKDILELKNKLNEDYLLILESYSKSTSELFDTNSELTLSIEAEIAQFKNSMDKLLQLTRNEIEKTLVRETCE